MSIRYVMGCFGAALSMSVIAAPVLPPIQLPPPPPAAADFKTYGAGLPLAEFARTTIGDVLHKAYVLTPAVASETVTISADFSRVKPADLLDVLRDVLDTSGYSIRDSHGVFIIDKKVTQQKQAAADEDDGKTEMLVYSPRYRSISSLSSYFVMFPKLKFSFGAGISRPVQTAAISSSSNQQQSSNQSGATLGSSFSSGETAFSQSNGDPTALVVKGTHEQLEKFQGFMRQVDVIVPEVVVRAYVFEVRDSTSNQSGVSLAMSIMHNHLQMNLGDGTSANNSIKLSLGSNSVSAAISALSGDSRVHLMSSPVLRAADGSSASASIGTDTPTLGSVTTSNGAATQSIQYQSAGVLLTISPRVFEESIRLKVSQEVSSFVTTDTGLSSTPTKLRRAFVSDVVAKAGDVVLLGGLNDVQKTATKSKGLFGFGTTSASSDNNEIVVLLAIDKP